MMSVHPLEQLRYIARRWEIDGEFPAQEVAAVLAELASENPASLLQACRRLIDYFPSAWVAWMLMRPRPSRKPVRAPTRRR